eukprot:1370767-Rhodomonas_salina.1
MESVEAARPDHSEHSAHSTSPAAHTLSQSSSLPALMTASPHHHHPRPCQREQKGLGGCGGRAMVRGEACEGEGRGVRRGGARHAKGRGEARRGSSAPRAPTQSRAGEAEAEAEAEEAGAGCWKEIFAARPSLLLSPPPSSSPPPCSLLLLLGAGVAWVGGAHMTVEKRGGLT